LPIFCPRPSPISSSYLSSGAITADVMRLDGRHIGVPKGLIEDFGWYAETIERCSETSAKTATTFPSAVKLGPQHAKRETIEVHRSAAASAGEAIAVAGIAPSMLIKRAPEYGDDGHGILTALFGVGRPDVRAPHAAGHADFAAGVILPAKAANLGRAQAGEGCQRNNRRAGSSSAPAVSQSTTAFQSNRMDRPGVVSY